MKEMPMINSLDECNDAMTTQELCQFLRIGMNLALRLIKEKKVRAIKVGREYRIVKSSVAAMLSGKEAV